MNTVTTQRFAHRIRLDPDTGCWFWRGSVDVTGRPVTHDGSTKSARRQVYEEATGQPIPPGWKTTYTCEQKRCVCPAHTAVHSPAGMTAHCWRRNDFPNGAARSLRNAQTKQQHGKLNWDKVREIRRRLQADEKAIDLAPEYGVSFQTISHVGTYRTWREPMGLAALVHQVMTA